MAGGQGLPDWGEADAFLLQADRGTQGAVHEIAVEVRLLRVEEVQVGDRRSRLGHSLVAVGEQRRAVHEHGPRVPEPVWDPAAEGPEAARLLKAARTALCARTGDSEAVHGNRITAGRLQLRLGRDLRWYPYARSDMEWEPSGRPEGDPALALAAL